MLTPQRCSSREKGALLPFVILFLLAFALAIMRLISGARAARRWRSAGSGASKDKGSGPLWGLSAPDQGGAYRTLDEPREQWKHDKKYPPTIRCAHTTAWDGSPERPFELGKSPPYRLAGTDARSAAQCPSRPNLHNYA